MVLAGLPDHSAGDIIARHEAPNKLHPAPKAQGESVADQRVQRRLAGDSLPMDMVGYSLQMGCRRSRNAFAFDARSPAMSLIRRRLEHDGRIVKEVGEGLLIEFASAVERSRLGLRHADAPRLTPMPPRRKTAKAAFRIGINIGDLIVEGDDIYGDGASILPRGSKALPNRTQSAFPRKHMIRLRERSISSSKTLAIATSRTFRSPFACLRWAATPSELFDQDDRAECQAPEKARNCSPTTT